MGCGEVGETGRAEPRAAAAHFGRTRALRSGCVRLADDAPELSIQSGFEWVVAKGKTEGKGFGASDFGRRSVLLTPRTLPGHELSRQWGVTC